MSDLLLDTVRVFADREVQPAAAGIDGSGQVPSELVSAIRAMGLLSIGDDGLGPRDFLDVVEIIARSSASVAMLVVAPHLVAPSSTPELDRAAESSGATTGLRGVHASGVSSAGRHRELLLGIAAVAIGVAARAHELAATYATSRTAFGRPLTGFPVLEGALNDMLAATEVSRAVLARAVGTDGVPEAVDAAGIAARAAVRVTFAAIQLHGGYGYMVEYGVERLARDAISLRALVSTLTSAGSAGIA